MRRRSDGESADTLLRDSDAVFKQLDDGRRWRRPAMFRASHRTLFLKRHGPFRQFVRGWFEWASNNLFASVALHGLINANHTFEFLSAIGFRLANRWIPMLLAQSAYLNAPTLLTSRPAGELVERLTIARWPGRCYQTEMSRS
ncbi:hypothetical protein CUJ89_36405 [Burkholderia pyrrocinia]|uniref:Uncharacterized protein n=1 Tax=Burkholderia pyrrocinia TaxID=60550 RepID=A0A2Z5NAI7_BURPY|nr:hypothetical protein CUJ89_36405 [Burkholderia pyrrocinia]